MSSDRHRGWGYPPDHRQARSRGGYSYHDGSEREDYSSRHYVPQYGGAASGGSYNYWQDLSTASTPYYPRNPYQRDTYEERRYDGEHRSRYRESTYSGPYHDSRSRGTWESRRSRSTGHYPWRHHYSTLQSPSQTQPYLVPPTFRSSSSSTGPILTTVPPPPAQPKPKPTPPPQPPPSKPDPEYLSLSQGPSNTLQEPSSSRKLLVLDLNGTLLIRSQHSTARSHTPSGPKLRAVQPRPYMRSFREYLFAPETKAWLDTMVWSSAQPHSVEDMVNNVFGSYKSDLRAVWTRRSLGLSVEEYNRKTLTTKDLAKPWKLLPLGSQMIHSALTTLLLDDSPHKALLQPYNHVCIPEYDNARRQHDLQSLNATRKPKEGKRSKKQKSRDKVEAVAAPDHTVDHVDSASPRSDTDLSVSNSLSSACSASSDLAVNEPFDVTLLAVIGILDVVKLQSNVAAWIRGGGLLAMEEESAEVGAVVVIEELNVDSALPTPPSNDRRAKKRRRTKAKMAAQADPEIPDKRDGATVAQTGNDTNTTSDPAVTPEEAHLRATMWFDGPSTLAHWVARGRKALNELGIEVSHGVTG
ncbi:hypothetical protein BS17DRAFT_713875 [Gyrodon lividus]|nr:hypothetical protein BS17DRAFT_713875 [Gyrodon lividus]